MTTGRINQGASCSVTLSRSGNSRASPEARRYKLLFAPPVLISRSAKHSAVFTGLSREKKYIAILSLRIDVISVYKSFLLFGF